MLGVATLFGIVFLFDLQEREAIPPTFSYKNAEYVIEGQRIMLENGVAETTTAPGSASKTVTRYFGNELEIDLNNDGRKDIVFLLTQQGGGSGTFYYAVAALNTELGYVGSDGYLLGDRVAPQNIEVSQNPRHVNVVVVNYADRAAGEPMTTQPSLGKSVYLKLDEITMQWAIVEPDFEGEEDSVAEVWSTLYGTVWLGPTCPVVMDPPDPQCADKPYATSLALTTSDGTRVIKTFSSDEEGRFNIEVPPGQYVIRSAADGNILPYCQSNGILDVPISNSIEVQVSCDTGIR